MSEWRFCFIVITLGAIILRSGEASETGNCEEGRSCMETKNCPEYQHFLSIYKTLPFPIQKTKKQEWTAKVCNRKLRQVCCNASENRNPIADPGPSPDTCKRREQSYAKSFLPAADQCGVSCSGSKSVVHGEDASLGEFPWAALLGSEKKTQQWDNRYKEWVNKTVKRYHCGGTLINPWFVLTAAHCHTMNTNIIEVVLGEWDVVADPDCPIGETECDNPRVQRQKVANIIIHSDYEEKAGPNDIALIRMKSEAQLNRFVQFACLPLPEYNLQSYFYNPEKQAATVVGWGESSNRRLSPIYHGLSTKTLQKGGVRIHSMAECRKAYPKREIHSSQLCARDPVTKTDSCRGDSGGGLFMDSGDYPGQSQGNVHVQVGVVSYGTQLCGDAPGVYTRVDQFIPWIRDNIGQ